MNRDEFKFLIVNTQILWQEGKIELDEESKNSIEITEEGISLRKYYTHILTESYPFGLVSPVDFALDSCGLLYILDSTEKRLAIFDTSTKTCQWVECISFSDPKVLTIDPSNIYVADGGEVCCLAKANYQFRWKASVEGGNLVDMALDSKQSLYVLDRNSQQVFKIDKAARLSTVSLTTELKGPVNIALDSKDHLYILEYIKGAEDAEDEARVLTFDLQGALESTISLPVKKGFLPSGLAVDEGGNIYIGEKYDLEALHKPSEKATPIQIDPWGKVTPIGYEGATYRLILNKKGDLYILSENEIAFLKLVERYINKGIYITKLFDSTVPGCQWHKVVIDADIPANTIMNVSHYISDDETAEPTWSEPMVNFKDALLLSPRGRYIRFKIELVSDDLHSDSPKVKSLKVYFPRLSYLRYLPATYQEDKAGREFLERFLSLFETLFSNLEGAVFALTKYIDSEAAPDAFLPWLSSWLAIAYDENWEEEKVRKLIEKAPELYKKRGTRAGIEEIIEIYTGEEPIVVENFQLKCIEDKPVEYKLEQKAYSGESRLFLKDTSNLEIEDIIKISDGIKEEFAVICDKEDSALKLRGKITFDYGVGATVRKLRIEEVLYGDCPYRFCVLLRPFQVKTANEFTAITRIIEREKPAHTTGGIRALQPWIYLDMHTYLGINTTLTEPVFILGESSVISRDTVLSDVEEAGQIDLRSRLAIDTKLT